MRLRQIYSVYVQMDGTLRDKDWPLVIQCCNCNDVMQLHINNKGIVERQRLAADQEVQGICISYSVTLPVPMILYMKPNIPVGMHSPFMMLPSVVSR